MELFLNDALCRTDLFPFTEIRHTADIRVGILTIKEKWERLTESRVSLISETKLLPDGSMQIPANIIPTTDNYKALLEEAVQKAGAWANAKRIIYPWHISQYNDWALRMDYHLVTRERKSEVISKTNNLIHPEKIFLEEGVKMEYCTLNASEGPIYLGRNAHIMEGCMIRGPFAAGDHSLIKMGAKIYNGTSIGPWCVAGGEIKNSVLFAFSNKAHDGYLGDSVIGEWCNLGAGTSNSNVKNTAGDVLYSFQDKSLNAGLKAGLIMGDYSKAAINTSFNTGTIVGISCNIFGTEVPPKSIANFTWGKETYQLDKAIRDIRAWKKLKNREFSDAEIQTLTAAYTK